MRNPIPVLLLSQITGVKHVAVSARRTESDAMALVYDIDVRWAGAPDISLLLAPSRKWIVKQRRIGAPHPHLPDRLPPADPRGDSITSPSFPEQSYAARSGLRAYDLVRVQTLTASWRHPTILQDVA